MIKIENRSLTYFQFCIEYTSSYLKYDNHQQTKNIKLSNSSTEFKVLSSLLTHYKYRDLVTVHL